MQLNVFNDYCLPYPCGTLMLTKASSIENKLKFVVDPALVSQEPFYGCGSLKRTNDNGLVYIGVIISDFDGFPSLTGPTTGVFVSKLTAFYKPGHPGRKHHITIKYGTTTYDSGDTIDADDIIITEVEFACRCLILIDTSHMTYRRYDQYGSEGGTMVLSSPSSYNPDISYYISNSKVIFDSPYQDDDIACFNYVISRQYPFDSSGIEDSVIEDITPVITAQIDTAVSGAVDQIRQEVNDQFVSV